MLWAKHFARCWLQEVVYAIAGRQSFLREELVLSHIQEWNRLCVECGDPAADQKVLGKALRAYAASWGRLSFREQGEISARVLKDVRRAAGLDVGDD